MALSPLIFTRQVNEIQYRGKGAASRTPTDCRLHSRDAPARDRAEAIESLPPRIRVPVRISIESLTRETPSEAARVKNE